MWSIRLTCKCVSLAAMIQATAATCLAICPNDKHTCYETGGPGCSDAECCETICAVDVLCCQESWDNLCVMQAFELCSDCGNANAGNCCSPHSSSGCLNAACCQCVCLIDPSCCENAWDPLCVDLGGKECLDQCGCEKYPNCPNPDHSCYVVGPPGCDNKECCQLLCALDPFCCELQFDGICAAMASQICAGCGEPESGDCCSSHATPGCDNDDCCSCVCHQDAFCCDVAWDELCVAIGDGECFDSCGCDLFSACPNPEHSCYAIGSPGCDNEACCEIVCALDPFCCEDSFDSLCVAEALEMCGNCGDVDAGSCCVADTRPGCDNVDCCTCVCAIDAHCCDMAWDALCVDLGGLECLAECGCEKYANCPNPDHSCYVVGAPGCDNKACCQLLCAMDPFCCELHFDGICAAMASLICAGCGEPEAGDCCQTQDSAGCNLIDCCRSVCETDAFCCDVQWDQLCVDVAWDEPSCECSFCPNDDHNCFTTGTPGCSEEFCCVEVCEHDPLCCEIEWDELCVEQALDTCTNCGGPGSSSCFVQDNTPACNDAACCGTVCAIDPWCCEVQWDDLCVDEAFDLCTCEVVADVNCDDQVGPADLGILLSSWGRPSIPGTCSCSTDINGDGDVGPADLAQLLANWG